MPQAVNALLYTTIGDLIRQYREQANLTISQLGQLTGIHKGVISKIENGDTKRPELKTIKSLSHVLEIPYAQIVEHYIEVEQRTEALRELLLEAIAFANKPLITKVALKFLESSQEESDTALERLHQLAADVESTDIQLLLYDLIITYSRQRGIQRFLAKGLLQKYLIERMDLKRLEDSYRIGEEILHYLDFLSREEKITYYFRMALHAHNIKKYIHCIELAEAGLAIRPPDSELKARAYLAMINSYYFLEEYQAVEHHLEIFRQFPYDFVPEAAKLTLALVKARKKEYHLAVGMLEECLHEISEHSRIHVVNELLDTYFHLGAMEAITKLLEWEDSLLSLKPQTPYQFLAIGRYFQLKGKFLCHTGRFDEGVESYVRSFESYGQVSAFQEIAHCMYDVLTQFSQHAIEIKLYYVERLKMVYNTIIGSNSKRWRDS